LSKIEPREKKAHSGRSSKTKISFKKLGIEHIGTKNEIMAGTNVEPSLGTEKEQKFRVLLTRW